MSKYTLGGDPPQSRAEQILMGEDVVPQSRLEELLLEKNVDPQSRIEDLLNEDVDPGSVVLINKTITENGTYNAANDNADGYKRVTVNVANTYAASDEGKVVSNGTLMAQTAHEEVTQNGTIDTTLNDSVTIAVPIPTYPIAENNSFGGGS